ncbi:hypothetical protein CW304_14405 [Bacillus sp. UFRGS-B20]|nr:hypothetical protein CW304_14405 [Bacillus sp. UFRGS-B20]
MSAVHISLAFLCTLFTWFLPHPTFFKFRLFSFVNSSVDIGLLLLVYSLMLYFHFNLPFFNSSMLHSMVCGLKSSLPIFKIISKGILFSILFALHHFRNASLLFTLFILYPHFLPNRQWIRCSLFISSPLKS